MTWTEEHDTLLCREILVEEPFSYRHGSRERGKCWDRIAEFLNKIELPKFSVDQRAVRDRYVKLEKAFKRKTREELRASGIAPDEPTELDQALEEINARSENAEQERDANREGKQQEMEREKETAETMRRRAMESLSQTRSREGCKKRKSGETSEYVGYLREKRAVDMRVRESQVDLKRREVCLEEKRVEGELELKQRELMLREKELSLKESKLVLKERRYEQLEQKLERFEQHQTIFQQQLLKVQQQVSFIQRQNENILALCLKAQEKQ